MTPSTSLDACASIGTGLLMPAAALPGLVPARDVCSNPITFVGIE
jgi:hypothetical protein